MYATDFEFAGEKLSDYGMMLCDLGNNGLETLSSGADISFNHVKSCGGNKFYICSNIYESPYTTTFQICKNPCFVHNQNEMTISTEELSSLQKWLCRKNRYYKFKIYQNGYEHIYWNVTFSTKQIKLYNQVIAMELTLYTDAPFAYMDEIVIEKECLTRNFSFDIYDSSDEEGYIYPNVEITLLEEGNFQLKNSLNEKNITEIKKCSIGETISLYGSSQIIKTSLDSHKTLSKDFNYFFPKIINSYNENRNTFTCNIKCNILISYSPIKKIGI